jgi:hypothetical protein
MADPVSQKALIERQQIVAPDAIGVGALVWGVPRRAYDADVGSFPSPWINDEEGIALRIDALDYLLARPRPSCFWIADVGYVLMRALGVRFCYASYLNIGHNGSFQNGREPVLNSLCGRPAATQTRPARFFR